MTVPLFIHSILSYITLYLPCILTQGSIALAKIALIHFTIQLSFIQTLIHQLAFSKYINFFDYPKDIYI
jgi:hypothetical protein